MTLSNDKRFSSTGPGLAAVLAALGLALACAGPSTPREASGPPRRGATVRGSAEYAALSELERLPLPSGVAAGWDRERLWSPHVDWEPVVATDPVTAHVYQLTTRYYAPECPGCPEPAIVFRRSRDDGETWDEDRYFSRVGAWQVDPQLAVAADGTLYAAYIREWEVVFSRSFDRGASWTPPVTITDRTDGEEPTWGDKAILAMSGDGRHVYLAFNAADSYIVASHDFGESFSAAVRTSSRRYWFHSDGEVAADGTVYFVASNTRHDLTGRAHIEILRSTDGGGSWTTQRLDTSSEAARCGWWAPGCYQGYLGPSAGMAIDAAGTLLVAYNAGDRRRAPQKLWVRTSTDGTSWGPRHQVSHEDSSIHNAFPAVEAGPMAGDFRLVWQDDRMTRRPRRSNRKKRWNTWYRRTEDSGQTFGPAVRLSDAGRLEVYKHRRGYEFPFGDYLGLAVDAGGANHVVWGEGNAPEGDGGSWYTRGR